MKSPAMLRLIGSSRRSLPCGRAFSTYTKDASGTNTLYTPTPAGQFDGSVQTEGEPGSVAFKMLFKSPFGKAISPWHDIRLQTAEYGILNAVVMTPKMSTAKYEVACSAENNPIVPVMANSKPDHHQQSVPWNLSIFPETWSNPKNVDSGTDLPGDNYPLDVVEIGSAALPVGSVVAVKPLGILPVKIDGKLDWKVIAVNMEDPLAAELHDLENLQAKLPALTNEIRDWFGDCAYDGECFPRAKANEIIAICFDQWRELRFGNVKDSGLWTQKVTSWTDGL